MRSSSPTSARPTVLASVLVAALAVAAYGGTLGHGFALDDGPELVENAFVRSLAQAPEVFSTASWAGSGGAQVPMYRPLTTFTYSLGYAAHGLAPLGYHLVNVLLHAGVSVLVLLLAIRIGVPLMGGLLAGLLFAALPVHVEAVANIAGRKDLLVAAFALGATICHARALRSGGPSLVAAPLLLAGALLSKESGLFTGGLIAAHDLLFGREEWRRHRARALSLFATYAVLTLLFVAARHAVLDTLVFPRVPFDENPIAGAPTTVRLMTAVKVIGYGVRLLFVPAPLSADYSFAAIPPVKSLLDPAFLASAALVAGAAALALGWRRTFPAGTFGILWYAIALLPASNLLVPIGTIFGERLLYVPSVGFAIAAGAAFARIPERWRRTGWIAATLVLCAGSLQTWRCARAWADDLTVFSSAVAAQPESAKAQRMLGGALMEAGEPDAALAAFQRAIAITGRPGTPQERMAPALVEMGVALERLGRLADAESTYARVLSLDPGNVDATWRLGVVRWAQGDRFSAVRQWKLAVASDPLHARALNDLGVAAYADGDWRGAEAYWVRATDALPTLGSAWYRLGNLYERQGDVDRARRAWTRFLQTDPVRSPELREEVARKLAAGSGAR